MLTKHPPPCKFRASSSADCPGDPMSGSDHFPDIALNQQPLCRHRPFEIGVYGDVRLMAVRGTMPFPKLRFYDRIGNGRPLLKAFRWRMAFPPILSAMPPLSQMGNRYIILPKLP